MAPLDPWLEEQFFADILQSEEEAKGSHRSVSIASCYAEAGVDAGCNFLSTIVRVKVKYTTDNSDEILSRSFLIKVPLSNKAINESQFTENELQMYNEVIPLIDEVSQLKVAPKRYVCSLAECLVMEDLNEAGYVMRDSNKKLDFKHAKAALVTLAKFHAATIAVKREYPDFIERNGIETVYTNVPKYADRFKPRILIILYGLAKVLQSVEGCEKYGDILVDAGEAFWDLVVEMFKPNSKLNVLNHGDFWINNMMFKYDRAGFITDVKFVDYQMRRYCSPAIDLLYLFWTSADNGVRMRMFELLEMYRHTLNSSLAELGCSERLSRHELKEEISKCSPLILVICLYLPVVYPDPESPFDVSQVEATEEAVASKDFNVNPFLIPFKSKHFRAALPEMCKELETMKIFQVLVKNKK